MKILVIAAFCLQLVPLWAKSQTDEDRFKKFTSDFHRQMKEFFPYRELRDTAKMSFVTMLATIQNNKLIGGPKFSKDINYDIRIALGYEKYVLEKTDWKQIFPSIDLKKPFQVLIPFVYYRNSSFEKIDASTFSQIVTKALSTVPTLKESIYIMPVQWYQYGYIE